MQTVLYELNRGKYVTSKEPVVHDIFEYVWQWCSSNMLNCCVQYLTVIKNIKHLQISIIFYVDINNLQMYQVYKCST